MDRVLSKNGVKCAVFNISDVQIFFTVSQSFKSFIFVIIIYTTVHLI